MSDPEPRTTTGTGYYDDEEPAPRHTGRNIAIAFVLLLLLLAGLQWRKLLELGRLPGAEQAATAPEAANPTGGDDTAATRPGNPEPNDQTAAIAGTVNEEDPALPQEEPEVEAKAEPPAPEPKAEPKDEAAQEDAEVAAANTPEPKSQADPVTSEPSTGEPETAMNEEEPESAPPVPAHNEAGDAELVSRAERYLYGPNRNCDFALSLLRSAANRENARAQAKLGALYATGNCVDLDRVSAYAWFTSAQRKDPRNRYLQRNRQMVLSQMTQEERQRAANID